MQNIVNSVERLNSPVYSAPPGIVWSAAAKLYTFSAG